MGMRPMRPVFDVGNPGDTITAQLSALPEDPSFPDWTVCRAVIAPYVNVPSEFIEDAMPDGDAEVTVSLHAAKPPDWLALEITITDPSRTPDERAALALKGLKAAIEELNRIDKDSKTWLGTTL